MKEPDNTEEQCNRIILIECIERKLQSMDKEKIKCVLQFVIHIAG